jgi:uncharacterized protein YukE
MTGAAAFPSVDTGAMTACASSLQSVASSMSDHGTNVSALQQAVAGSEDWKGQAASRWQDVMTSRVADASLTNEVMSKAASLLDQLASGLEAEQQYYNKVNGQMQDLAGSYNPRFNPAPGNWQAPYISAMNASVTRANNLLKNFGDDFVVLAAMAGDITATTAANRTPGEPAGGSSASNSGAMSLLAILLGSVTGHDPGANFETEVLSELGLAKNTDTFRLNIPGTDWFLGPKLAKGTIPDSVQLSQGGYVVEIKYSTETVEARFQIRLEEMLAGANGVPFWVIVSKDAQVTPEVLARSEVTGGGVLVRAGPNTYTDVNGNPVKVGPGMKVTGYRPITTGGSGGSTGSTGSPGPSDPQAPAQPVDPADTTGPAPAGPAAPGVPDGPVEPGDPVVDPIDPLP